MKESRFIDALKQLSTRERSKFKGFIFSPFFNKNAKVRALVSYSLQYAPDFDHPDLDKKILYQHIYGQESAYQELRLNNLISDALKLFYQYIAQLEYMADEKRWRKDQMGALLDRQMSRHIPSVERRLIQLQAQQEQQSHRYFFEGYQLHEQLDQSMLVRQGREYSDHLQNASDALDQFYWCNKFRLACDMISRNKIIKAAYKSHFIDRLIYTYENERMRFLDQPAIKMYYQALLMLQSEAEEDYQSLRQLLDKYSPVLPIKEQYDLYDYAQNFCVKKINSGQVKYYQHILDLYKEMLNRKVLLRDGFLTQWSYINILTAGLRLPDFEWTEWFIHTYREQLKPEVRENVFTYSLAALFFERKDYYKALQSLQGVTFSDIFYHMSAKIIQLKSYYELQEHEAFLSLMEASRKFLRRNRQLSDYQVQSNLNFLKIAGKLNKINMRAGITGAERLKGSLKQLEKALLQTKTVTNKGWLSQKIDDLLVQAG
jgi:hypothetical protein